MEDLRKAERTLYHLKIAGILIVTPFIGVFLFFGAMTWLRMLGMQI